MRTLTLYQPHNLEDAATILLACLEDEERDLLRRVDEDDAVLMTRLGIGASIRDAWVYGPGGRLLRASSDFAPVGSDPGIPEEQISAAIVARAWALLRRQP